MHCKLQTVFYAAQQHCSPTLWPSNKPGTCAISVTGYESFFLGSQQAQCLVTGTGDMYPSRGP